MNMNRFAIVLAALLVFGLAAAQTLVFGNSGQPSSLDSADSQDGESLVVSGQITETLIGFAAGSAELEPKLAVSWSPNDAADVWTFELREGVQFHDGTPFDAEAVKFSYDRWNLVDHPYSFRDEGKNFVPFGWVFGGPRGEGGIIDEVVAAGELSVEFRLTQPVPFFPALVAANYFQIDSPAAVMEAGADYGSPSVGSVGTGPFVFEEWVEGQRVRLSANADYWGGAPSVNEVVFRPILEPTARLAELQAGAIDIAVNLPADNLQTVENDGNLVTAIANGELNVGYVGISHAEEHPMSDVRVRQAIAHAIDREAIVEAFYAGTGMVAEDHLAASLFGHGMDWPYEYDPERAQELLAEAGYADGFATELWYMPVSRPYYPSPQPIAETIASYLADVGIEAEVLTEDWTTYLSDYREGVFPMWMLGWNADYADPDNFLRTFFGADGAAAYAWDRDEVIDMLEEATRVADQDRRAELYADVIAAVAEQAASIPMAHNNTLHAHRTNISGWVPSPLGYSSVSLVPVVKQ